MLYESSMLLKTKSLDHIKFVWQHFVFDLEVNLCLQKLKGDELKDHIYFDFACEDVFVSHVPKIVFVNSKVENYNIRDHDQRRSFASKWPNLRTNHLKDGGYDMISIMLCVSSKRTQYWAKLEGPKCKMKSFNSMQNLHADVWSHLFILI